jgi:hypothetical protein
MADNKRYEMIVLPWDFGGCVWSAQIDGMRGVAR